MEYVTQKFDNNYAGQFIENVMVAYGEMDRHKIAERTAHKMIARTEAGYWVYGHTPAGYKPSKTRGLKEHDPSSCYVIKQALEGFAQGQFKNYTELANFLNAHKLADYKGKSYHFDGERAKNLLRWAWFHAGFVQNLKQGIARRAGKHEPLISTGTLEMIEKRLNGEKISPYRKNSVHFPLRKHVICSSCEKPMTGAFCGGRKLKYPYYYCRTENCENRNKNVHRDDMHAAFLELLRRTTPSQELLDQAQDVFAEVWKEEWKDLQKQRHQWGIDIENLNRQIQECVDQLLETSHEAVKAAIQKRIQDYSEREEVLKVKVKEYTTVRNDFDVVLKRVMELLKDPASIWDQADLALRHTIQRLIFPEGIIYDPKELKFRKAVKAPLFLLMEESTLEKAEMAPRAGFEPATN